MTRNAWRAYLLAVFAALFLPIGYLVLMSVNRSPYGMLPLSFSGQWYRMLLQEPDLIASTLDTLLMSGVVATVSALVGTLAALALVRRALPARLRAVLEVVNLIPITVPWLVLGVAMLLFLLALGSGRGMLNLYLGNLVVVLPYVILLVVARLREVGQEQEEAAVQLGAGPAVVFARITVPRVLPAVLAGSIMAFIVSFNNFLIQYFLAPFGFKTLPMQIYGLVRNGVRPDINALSTVLVLIAVVTVVVLDRLVGVGASLGRTRRATTP